MSVYKILYNLIMIYIGVFLLYALYGIVVKGNDLHKFPDFIWQIGTANLFFCLVSYLFSHFLRTFRIAVMFDNQNFSIWDLVGKQFYTNAVNLVVPFKLGEVYRVIEFNKLIKNPNKTFITIMAERSIDFFILFIGLIVSLVIERYKLVHLQYTTIIGVTFITGVLFVYFVLPENIRSFNLFIAKRNSGKWVIQFLSISSRLYKIILEFREIFKNRYLTIFLLSFLIWGSEIMAFTFVFGYLGSIKLFVLLAFLVFLSSLVPSGSIGLGGLQLAFYIIYTLKPDFKYLELSFIYQLFIFVPAILIGGVIYIISKYKENRQMPGIILK